MLNALHGHLDRWRDAAQLLEEVGSRRRWNGALQDGRGYLKGI